MKARLIHAVKLIDELGGIEERKIWAVPKDSKSPDGIRYRLRTPMVLYDNHHPKGHHKHIGGRQSAYEFSSVEALLRDFRRDIEALK